MNYNGPKVKIARKLGFATTPKADKYMTRKPYPPGQHGQSKRRGKQSDFGKQLLEKQRLRLQFNISERQMVNYYKKAVRMAGNSGDNFIQLLESRLDALVYRAGFSRSIYAARQYVGHGHIFVNGRVVNIPSYSMKVNEVIAVKEKSRSIECFKDAVRNSAPPAYLEVSKADFTAKYLYIPQREDIPVVCEIPLVVEYYSR